MEVGASGVVVEMFGGQSASGEELSTHCGGPATLPVCGGSDRISAQEKKQYWLLHWDHPKANNCTWNHHSFSTA